MPDQDTNRPDISDEQLMLFVDGELHDPDLLREINELPDRERRLEPFRFSRQLMEQLKTGVFEEPGPEELLTTIRGGLASATRAEPTARPGTPTNFIREVGAYLRNRVAFGAFSPTYGMVSVTAATVLAVGLYLGGASEPTLFMGPRITVVRESATVERQPHWEDRYASLGTNVTLEPAAWFSEDANRFDEFTLVRFRSLTERAGYELVLNQMLEQQTARGLITHPDQKREWLILRGKEKVDPGLPTNSVIATAPAPPMLRNAPAGRDSSSTHDEFMDSLPIDDNGGIGDAADAFPNAEAYLAEKLASALAQESENARESASSDVWEARALAQLEQEAYLAEKMASAEADALEAFMEPKQCFIGELIDGELENPEQAQSSRFLRFCPAAQAERFSFLN